MCVCLIEMTEIYGTPIKRHIKYTDNLLKLLYFVYSYKHFMDFLYFKLIF